MSNIDTLHQLQNRIAEMEQRHEEELRKLKADNDQLEAHLKCLQGGEHSAHTSPEGTQGESHPRHTFNTLDILSLSHAHHPARRTTRRHPFVHRIMEVNIPIGWKPLNQEQYDGIADPDEHLDTFLTQVNLCINNDAIMCRVFLTSLKVKALTWYGGLPPNSIDRFNTLVERFDA